MISVASCLLVSAVAGQTVKPFVHPLFTDNMVLQRNMQDPVWGWASPGEEVTVKFRSQTKKAKAGSDGKWMVKVGPFQPGGPDELVVIGRQSQTFKNVLVGDVWICSGQSNMEMGIGAIDAPSDIASANYPNIRLFAAARLPSAKPLEYTPGTWKVCTPENVGSHGVWGGFSAVGYFFGKKLNQELNIPIGLIHTSWGGTIAEAWTESGLLAKKLPEFKPGLAAVAQAAGGQVEDFAAWYKKYDLGTKNAWSSASFGDSSWSSIELPKLVQESGLPGFTARQSVIWFRKTLDLSASDAARINSLRFVADDDDATWVNGQQVGATEGYSVQRSYNLPQGLLKAGKNTIAVRVTDGQSPGGIYGAPETLQLGVASGEPISLVGTWKVKLGGEVKDNPFPISINGNPNLPAVLYNGMIAPLTPFGVKGAIWYQGESNAGRGMQYRKLLPTMITSWRKSFQSGDFPFLIVQLAGFMNAPAQPGEDNWAELREAQFLTGTKFKNSGIMTAVDIGDPADIHPKNKQDVGGRLALVALKQVYKKDVVAYGPTYKSAAVEGNAIRVNFDHTDGGLISIGGAPRGFAIAGADKKWQWADARIEGYTVLVSSPLVPKPVAVRYYWSAFSTANLANGTGLPAFPFRTDDWKLLSDKR